MFIINCTQSQANRGLFFWAFRRHGLLCFLKMSLSLKRNAGFFCICGGIGNVHFVETVCYVFSQPLCFTWLEGHFVNISQDQPIKTPWVFDTSIFRCSKNTTPPMQNDHFVDLGLFHDLPFTFAMSKKVSNRLESEWHFYNMWKITPPKSYTYDNVIVYKSFRILHHSLFICILPCALTIHTRV